MKPSEYVKLSDGTWKKPSEYVTLSDGTVDMEREKKGSWVKEFLINVGVGSLAISILICLWAGVKWLDANHMMYVVVIPLTIVVYISAACIVGAVVRAVIQGREYW